MSQLEKGHAAFELILKNEQRVSLCLTNYHFKILFSFYIFGCPSPLAQQSSKNYLQQNFHASLQNVKYEDLTQESRMQCISNYDQTRLYDHMHSIKCQIMNSSMPEGSLRFIKNNMGFSTGFLDTHGYFSEGERDHMKIVIHLPLRCLKT